MGYLKEYLGPLLREDEGTTAFWTEHLTRHEVTQAAIKAAKNMKQLDEYASALLQYYLNTFIQDYKILPVPMFISPSLRSDLICASCREKDVDGTVA